MLSKKAAWDIPGIFSEDIARAEKLGLFLPIPKDGETLARLWASKLDPSFLAWAQAQGLVAPLHAPRADLRGADLRGIRLSMADLNRADLRGADLRGAVMGRANFFRADLRGADLRGGSFRRADFQCADLRGALVSGADFFCANLVNLI